MAPVKAEGWNGEVTVDSSGQIEEVTLGMRRGKLALELTQGFSTDAGNEMAFVLEGEMRYDDGDGVPGAGMRAFSSGVRYELGAGVGVRLKGTRRASTLGGAQHSVGIRGRVRFR